MARLDITDPFWLFAGYLLAFCQQITGIDLAHFADTTLPLQQGRGDADDDGKEANRFSVRKRAGLSGEAAGMTTE